MRSAYRTLCYLVAFDVMLQAAFIAWAVFGLGKWVDDGGVLDKSVKNDTSTFHFTEERGFMFHGINGQMVIPLLVIVLLVVAFRANVPGGVAWAAVLVGLVAIQAFLLPVLGEDFPAFGAVHGLNALLIFGTALLAGRRVDTTVAEPAAV